VADRERFLIGGDQVAKTLLAQAIASRPPNPRFQFKIAEIRPLLAKHGFAGDPAAIVRGAAGAVGAVDQLLAACEASFH
jgi:hypothetical protein